MTESTYVKDALVWIDCEMTGLDLTKDALIEVAVIVTDADLNPLDKGIDILIKPSEESLAGMDDFVRKMHTSSGLLEELAECTTTMEEAEQQVLDYVSQFTPARKALLAGNSIGTDKSFLARDMPKLIDYLHYRVVDVSSLKEMARRWFPRTFYQSPDKHGGHRALADIQESLIELYYYRSVLFPEGDGPSTAECQQKARQAKKWFATITKTEATE
ncbi:oligoribonuclease [Boudabousia marimammalium]|uniref:Oligoribonuclease n=1 Tax=Boudabousia marimammalium TaxID=156892 RepID=A0A1Q5PPM7_9ACTO|nr:oligoribonuclease [Boudabousia marimammalium]OKL49355.1 oligoribonuclease [Boudabousia marimammalium]